MSLHHTSPPTRQSTLPEAEILCLGAALAWLVLTALIVFIFPWPSAPGILSTAMVILLPALTLGGAGWILRNLRLLNQQVAELQHALQDIGQQPAPAPQAPRSDPYAAQPEPLSQHSPPAEEISTAEHSWADEYDDQPDLALETPDDGSQHELEIVDLIRAINFPDSAEDKDGFDALHRALDNRPAAHLIQASQDMLTLLSQDGLFMEELEVKVASPELWRRFARGERGPSMSALGGVSDQKALELVAARMREEEIFRDAAHHFLRRFDSLLQKAEPEMTDEDLLAMAQTRTARAFMLVGRVTGAFN